MGEIHRISPILLSLGSNWEVILPRFCPKTDGFVRFLQLVGYFVNFLQDVLLRIRRIASVHTRGLYVRTELVACPFYNEITIAPTVSFAIVIKEKRSLQICLLENIRFKTVC